MDLPTTFPSVETRIADMLAEGARDRGSAAHTPVVSTGDGDMRVMVLRAFDRNDWTLRFNTDRRSPKCRQLEADPTVHILVYDRDAKTQLRLAGSGQIVSAGPLVDAAWASSTRFARRCYMGMAPGDVSDSPTTGLPPSVEGVEPTERELADARENFALLVVALRTADWFALDHHGHRRALLNLTDPKSHRWVAP